ncbi:MAG: hypothetical protein ACTSRY_05585 [Alphaproteobacteria bacterium]
MGETTPAEASGGREEDMVRVPADAATAATDALGAAPNTPIESMWGKSAAS